MAVAYGPTIRVANASIIIIPASTSMFLKKTIFSVDTGKNIPIAIISIEIFNMINVEKLSIFHPL